ncbi:ribonucleoside-diphosphate reductase subunit alpha [Radiobacillus deserti]|uniref:Ribonucleoside-diphosphate reductase n=1 Tax=Radiobacillus deserti TaxID=2594883 RepID=A0A516KCT1_9BACI|nr:ribonucleoside-diphosphate reductase subunit alpha [Radiobacillus deserti]QDP39213.1 ribonucleoside-diphosphate reductase subunit alpha [Radiobacillus deserti]
MTVVTKDRKSYIQKTDFSNDRFNRFVDEIVEASKKDFEEGAIQELKQKIIEQVKGREEIEAERLFDLIIRESNDLITKETPYYTYLSASALLRKIYKRASKERGFDYRNGYGDYASLVRLMTENGLYSEELIEAYTESELKQAGEWIDRNKDKLFSFPGLFLLDKNYLVKGYNGEQLELPQERFLTTALYLMKDEPKSTRMEFAKEAYWALSNHFIGLATPTLMNSGKPLGTLSSCHILTMGDSLKSIMDVIKDVSTFSQNGAGIGVYMGYLRADGSWIRGFKGRSTGVVHPARLLSNISEYVNQLGARKGGVSVYLPLWHSDIFDFLDLRLKTGSQERRAHSIFTAVCIPDEFMRRLKNRESWTIVDPYEVSKKLGIDLNRLYDKKKLKDGEEPNEQDHAFTYNYRKIEKADLELKKVVQAKDIYASIYTARKTGGTPFLYYSDTASRMNPNSHKGNPKGSNLCTEIIQNMDFDKFEADELKEGGVVIQTKTGDGLVTCNLNSLVLPNVFGEQEQDLQRITDIQIRMLDNVISLNRTPVQQATYTNNQYRAVGAGAMGLATLIAEKQIQWDSEEASEFADEIFEKYAFSLITSSHKLAVEKGAYPLFEGSEWETGEYFDKRGYNSPEWVELKEKIAKDGVRNSYMMAVAPTGSNSVIMGGVSPSCDPLYEVIYQEEKAGMNVTMIPPNYSPSTMWFYKSAFEMDEMWSINVISSVQRHVDQGISHNMHIHKSIKASEMLRLDLGAWQKGLKTIYYTYTDTNAIDRSEGCIFCEA